MNKQSFKLYVSVQRKTLVFSESHPHLVDWENVRECKPFYDSWWHELQGRNLREVCLALVRFTLMLYLCGCSIFATHRCKLIEIERPWFQGTSQICSIYKPITQCLAAAIPTTSSEIGLLSFIHQLQNWFRTEIYERFGWSLVPEKSYLNIVNLTLSYKNADLQVNFLEQHKNKRLAPGF